MFPNRKGTLKNILFTFIRSLILLLINYYNNSNNGELPLVTASIPIPFSLEHGCIWWAAGDLTKQNAQQSWQLVIKCVNIALPNSKKMTTTSTTTTIVASLLPTANYFNTSTTSMHPIELVAIDETIADVALKQKASAGLSTSISVLMSILICCSFFLNSSLFATILSSYKLRASLLYLMFCILALFNLFDVLFIMLVSLLYVANGGRWIFGNGFCRLNALTQQFVLLATLLLLTLMAVERALSLIGRHLVTIKFFGILSLLFTIIPICFASPLFLPGFPVTIFPFRYLCAVGSGSPILYSIAQMLVYGGCFFVLLICFGSILKRKRIERNLPVKQQDYGAFIMESRALEEQINLSRLVLLLTLEFILIEGPYICLDFFYQLRNSFELLNRWDSEEMAIPQDVDTLITLAKLFHPLFMPMIIFATRTDIWTKFTNLLCCRSIPNYAPNSWTQPMGPNHDQIHPNVMTLYVTPEGGLHLRLPNEVVPHPSMMINTNANNSSTSANNLATISESESEEEEEERDDSSEGTSSSSNLPKNEGGNQNKQQQQKVATTERTSTTVVMVEEEVEEVGQRQAKRNNNNKKRRRRKRTTVKRAWF